MGNYVPDVESGNFEQGLQEIEFVGILSLLLLLIVLENHFFPTLLSKLLGERSISSVALNSSIALRVRLNLFILL